MQYGRGGSFGGRHVTEALYKYLGTEERTHRLVAGRGFFRSTEHFDPYGIPRAVARTTERLTYVPRAPSQGLRLGKSLPHTKESLATTLFTSHYSIRSKLFTYFLFHRKANYTLAFDSSIYHQVSVRPSTYSSIHLPIDPLTHRPIDLSEVASHGDVRKQALPRLLEFALRFALTSLRLTPRGF